MDKKFIICTDSGCDLNLQVLTENDICAMPLEYEMGGKVYVDTMLDEDTRALYDAMRNGAVPKTSQANFEKFIDFWTPIIEKYHLPIVHLSLGSGVSGTYQNGCIAAQEIKEKFPDAEIHMVDSTLCSVGYGMLALHASEMMREGKSAEECVEWLENNKARMNTWYTTDELKYLYRSGRVSKVGAVMADALNICPILNLDLEGHLITQEKVRGLKKTIRRIHEIVGELVENPEDEVAYVCHSDIEEKAREFGEEIKEKFGFKEMRYTLIGPTIGANCGPGLMAVFFYGKPRTMKGYKG